MHKPVVHKDKGMRLSAEEIQTIKEVGQQVLGAGTRVVLFGSRVSDHAQGGDIDLLFESPRPVARPAVATCDLYGALVMKLGDQKIDVVLSAPGMAQVPVIQQALKTGVEL